MFIIAQACYLLYNHFPVMCMKNTTLCYIRRDGKYLMLHRVKKENDLNHDKWIGLGGKFEADESPEECLLREIREESGLTLTSYKYRGIVTFVSDVWETEYMHLFTAEGFEGDLTDCDEGVLEWVDISALPALTQWQGDRIFLDLIAKDTPFFSLKLRYRGEELAYAALNGRQIVPAP
jgi:8-oxo-dGTP diphosphatase